ncbi:MAG: hypothetical protein GH143_04020 [Calditrichaeota bacterium]|nr:hypothetical protein [Calditrichota bacterium]MQY63458.1 hypothetical protein [Calditrichota bacterium]
MKPTYLLIIVLPLMLWLAGCEQTRPGIIENLIFSEGDQWLERDTDEDPYELVEGLCCNDYNPYPLPIDITIYPVIAPADDLDYFDIQVTDSYAGRLVLTPEDEDITFRIFNRTLNDEYNALVDTFDDPVGDNDHWTVLYGPSATFTVLVAGTGGDYVLDWERVIPTTTLIMEQPQADERWQRSFNHRIQWRMSLSEDTPVTVVLIKGPIMVEVLRRDITSMDELDWTPEGDLERGNDYRILVYLSNDPKVIDISDAFEIYY